VVYNQLKNEEKSQMDSNSADKKLNRRDFLKKGLIGAGLVLGNPSLYAQNGQNNRPDTNIADAMKIPRNRFSLPGLFPGKVVEIFDSRALKENDPNPEIISEMFTTGMNRLTDRNTEESFGMFFNNDDIIGIKVNPVGAVLISTRLELVDTVIKWLTDNGVKRQNIIIWDRFDYMLSDAGFTPDRYPGVVIEGLQTMDESAASGESDNNSLWRSADGGHASAGNFDHTVYYFADVEAPQDDAYLNQHVFNGKYSYFGKLLTKKIDKIINLPVFKNSGNGISMATKNLGYAAICNTGRLHKPLFFDVCTEVLAFPPVRDKLVLNITDGLRGQYEGGPGANAQFIFPHNKLYFATDPFAADMICHQELVRIRKNNGVNVNEHPQYTQYLIYAEELGLGITSADRINHIRV
jgi:hypothetical protein